MSIRIAALIGAVVWLAGCQTLATLPDGRATTLDELNAATRASVIASTGAFAGPALYRPVEGCDYRVVELNPSGGRGEYGGEFTLRPVRDRLLATLTADGSASTALLGEDGRLHDFNTVNPLTGRRWTSENYAVEAAAMLQTNLGKGAVINELEVWLPRLEPAPWRYGDIVSVIDDHTGGRWGWFQYAGTALYEDRRIIILDLLRPMPGQGTVVVGFNFVDAERLTPRLSIVQLGALRRLDVTGCD